MASGASSRLPGVDNAHRRPFSAGDTTRRGHSVLSPDERYGQLSSLERGVVGVAPPLIRQIDYGYTEADVAGILAVRDKAILSAKRKLQRISRQNEAAEATILALTEEVSEFKCMATKDSEKQVALQERLVQAEETLSRKVKALRASVQRRERVAGEAVIEVAQAESKIRRAEEALEEATQMSDSLKGLAEDAKARADRLEARMLETTRQREEQSNTTMAELKREASARDKERALYEQAALEAAEEQSSLRISLDEALRVLRLKREAEEETDMVIKELQAWRERVTRGDVLEMSPTEVKRLRWSEEQGEKLKEDNARLRSELVETARLLAEAEHAFERVTSGFGDAAGTIGGLSSRLDQMEASLKKADQALRVLRAEAGKKKRRINTLEVDLSEARRHIVRKERALDTVQKGMEALARGKQQESEAKGEQAEKRLAAENAAKRAAEQIEMHRWRVAQAEAVTRELDAERRVLFHHLGAARREATILRRNQSCLSATGQPVTTDRNAHEGVGSWIKSTRSLLERAISDWSLKILHRRQRISRVSRQKELKRYQSPKRGGTKRVVRQGREVSLESDSRLSSSSESESTSDEKTGHDDNCESEAEGTSVFSPGRKTRWRVAEAGVTWPPCQGDDGGEDSNVPQLEVARVYRPPNGEGNDRGGGWRWDLAFATGTGGGRKDRDRLLADLRLEGAGRSLRELGVRGEGAKAALGEVARVSNALIATRALAAKQCAEVRAELARAIARLSSRAAFVSETHVVARQASSRNLTLIMRLVDVELHQGRAQCANDDQVATRGTADTLNARALSDGDVPQNKHSSDDGERVCQSISHSSGSDSDDSGSSSSKHNEDRSADPTRRRRPQRRGATRHKRQHRWRPTQRKAFAGVTLDLSDAGIDDEALYLVVRKLLKNCTPPTSADQIPNIDPPTLSPTQRMASPSTRPTTSAAVRKTTRSRPAWIGDETLTGKPSDTPAQDQAQATRVVPLSRLILSGNYVTDMGALTLCPLVEASATLAEIDLRDTFIGRKGELVLKKALKKNRWVNRVTSEDICERVGEDGTPQGRTATGSILRARRCPQASDASRARAHAFARIPPLRGHPSDDCETREIHEPTDSSLQNIRTTASRSSVCLNPTTRSGDPCYAPAHGSPAGGGLPSQNPHSGKRLHLVDENILKMRPTDAVGANVIVAPSCKIDLRGCSRRPLPLPVIKDCVSQRMLRDEFPGAPPVVRDESTGGRAACRGRHPRLVERDGGRRTVLDVEVGQKKHLARQNAICKTARTATLTSTHRSSAGIETSGIPPNPGRGVSRKQRRRRRRSQRKILNRMDFSHRTPGARPDDGPGPDELKHLLSESFRMFRQVDEHGSFNDDSDDPTSLSTRNPSPDHGRKSDVMVRALRRQGSERPVHEPSSRSGRSGGTNSLRVPKKTLAARQHGGSAKGGKRISAIRGAERRKMPRHPFETSPSINLEQCTVAPGGTNSKPYHIGTFDEVGKVNPPPFSSRPAIRELERDDQHAFSDTGHHTDVYDTSEQESRNVGNVPSLDMIGELRQPFHTGGDIARIGSGVSKYHEAVRKAEQVVNGGSQASDGRDDGEHGCTKYAAQTTTELLSKEDVNAEEQDVEYKEGYPQDEPCWVYDEATASWYVAGASQVSDGICENGAHNEFGWWFNEVDRLWYHTGSTRHKQTNSIPEEREPQSSTVKAEAALNSSSPEAIHLKIGKVTSPDQDMDTKSLEETCQARPYNEGRSQKVTPREASDDNRRETGELVADRIRQLELALKAM